MSSSDVSWGGSDPHRTSRASVDLEDAEDMWRGGGVSDRVKPEGGAGDGLELRPFVQPQEAGHLAGLQEVEWVGPGRGGGPVSLHALQLLRLLADGLHIQLDVLRLLLIEQHLAEQEVDACLLHGEGALLLVVPDGFTHVERPLLPALYHASFSHLLRGDFGYLKMRRRFLSIPTPSSSQRPPVSFDPLSDQQLSLLQYELNDGLPLSVDLLESVLQDLEGLGQVPRLSPSPRREERAARGQSQSQQRQRSPEHPQPAHPPPLQNPLHVGAHRCYSAPHTDPKPRCNSIPHERAQEPQNRLRVRRSMAEGSSAAPASVRLLGLRVGLSAAEPPLLPSARSEPPSATVRGAARAPQLLHPSACDSLTQLVSSVNGSGGHY